MRKILKINPYARTHTHTHAHARTHTGTHTNMNIHMLSHTRNMHTHIYTRTHTYAERKVTLSFIQISPKAETVQVSIPRRTGEQIQSPDAVELPRDKV